MRRGRAAAAAIGRSPDLRRVAAGYALFNGVEHATWIAILVYAYRDGGAAAAGAIAVAQLVPSAVFAALPGALADRHRPGVVLAGAYALQAVTTGACAAALVTDAPALVVYALAVASGTTLTGVRPAQAALVPSLARSPDELTAMNALTGWVEAVATLVAPLLAGLGLALAGPGLVFAACTAAVALGGLLVLPLRDRAPARGEGRPSTVGEIVEGVRVLGGHEPTRLTLLVLAAQYVVVGALDVIVVILAIETLDLGDGGAGYLYAAIGAGGIVGALSTFALVGRTRLVPPLLAACVVWGVAFVLLGLSSELVLAIGLLALSGASRVLLDVTARTLLQRLAPTRMLSRVFALVETVAMAGLALGAIAAPLLIGLGGVEAAFVTTGLLLPLLVLLRLRPLRRLDSEADVPVVEIALLHSLPLFAALPAPELEALARSLEPLAVPPGDVVVAEGDAGDHYFAIADGELVVTRGGAEVARLRRGEGFGEIALLRDVPRTATVTAATQARLLRLGREPFLLAVTGHGPAASEAERVVAERLPAPTGSGP